MRTLLLADDNITVQRVIALTFAQEPVRVVTASDGHQAMDRIMVDRPDIVLAGTTLPQVNGYALSRFVKSKPESKDVPVLLLSGAFESIDEAELRASGANGVIEKPVEPTLVIRRVRELLGLKATDPAPAAGRLVTPAAVTAGPAPSTARPRAVTTSRPMPAAWEQLRDQTLDQNARPAEDTTGRDDYLESLGDAFDTLDQQLSGPTPTQLRNPAPPPGQRRPSGDPRSPGRVPVAPPAAPPGNPVYEVDEDWFGDAQSRDEARVGRRQLMDDLRAPELAAPSPAAGATPAQPVYEVDDEWFAEDQKAREARQMEQRELAREMGIHEVELPEPAPAAPRVASDDFEFGEADLTAALASPPAGPPKVPEAPEAAVPPRVAEPPGAIAPPAVTKPPRVVEPPKVAEAPPVINAPKVVEPPRIIEVPQPVDVRHVPELVTPVVEVALASATPSGYSPERDQGVEPAAVIEMTLSVQRDTDALAIEPIARTLPIDFFAAISTRERQPAPPASAAGGPPSGNALLDSATEPRRESRDVANDFDALLAFEQGTKSAPPMIEPIIHAVTPEITTAMLQEIATSVADRLKDHVHVEPLAPEITGEMLKTIAFLVAGSLKDSIHVEARAPEISGEMLKTIAYLVSGTLKDHVRVEPAPPVLTDEIIRQMAAMVSERLAGSVHVEARAPEISGEMLEHVSYTVAGFLKDSIRVEPVAPQISGEMLDHVAATVADRLKDNIRVEPVAPQISGEMLDHVAVTVADRLKDNIRVEPVAPQISDEMLGLVAEHVSARLRDSIRVEPAIPELNSAMLDQIAGTVAARLGDTVRESVRVETVAPSLTTEMLDHVAARVSERVQSSMPPPPVPPQITDDMLERVAGRVAERLQGSLSIDHLRDSITGAIRDTVRAVVSETSERLVREEIERIKSKPQ